MKRFLALPVAAVALSGVLASTGLQSADAADQTLTVRAGEAYEEASVNLFLPANVTVITGTTLRWAVSDIEPHSITMFQGQPPADEPAPDPSPATFPNSKNVVNSGLIFPSGPAKATYDVKFAKAGSYDYFCIIHPNMTGVITVVDEGSAAAPGADNQLSLDARGNAEFNSASFEAKAALAALKSRPTEVVNKAGGAKAYTVKLGTETPNTQANINQPAKLTITAGDSVVFKSLEQVPHTATFGALPPGDPFEAPASKPGSAVDGTATVNSGVLLSIPDPSQANSFEMTFPKPGTYKYYCAIHSGTLPDGTIVGQQGEITVVARPSAPGAPNTGSGLVAAQQDGQSGWLLVIGATLAALIVAGGSLAYARK
ncbi:MAG: plastocyanin/azurin family copper-binding protein [Dehalococcoidia bacterium]